MVGRLTLLLGIAAVLVIIVAASAAASVPRDQMPLALSRTQPPRATSSDPAWVVRAPKPSIPTGPRRIGIQAGHWKTDEVPDELVNFRELGGAVSGDLTEWEYDLDIAQRVAALLQAKGFAVDVLPATIPEHYVADAFVSLHADGDQTGTARGFKVAHGDRRSPFDEALTEIMAQEYWKATQLPVDPNTTVDMLDYYAFRWERFQHALEPHTPAAILEMGFITNAQDVNVLLRQRDLVASAIASGITRFLAEVPQQAIFRDDLVFPRATPTP